MSSQASRARVFDWESARRALARTASALDAAHTPGADAGRDILRERARRLAQPAVPSTTAGQVPAIRFTVGAERYALELRFLREVSRPRHITPVPGAPDRILGVTNLRGEMLSVFDLAKLLDVRASATGPRDAGRLLVLGRQRPELGVVADAVGEVARLEALAPPPEASTARGGRYLRGLTPDHWIVLDGEALLDDRELVLAATEARDS